MSRIVWCAVLCVAIHTYYVHSQDFFFRPYGTFVPASEHVPISLYDDYGLDRYSTESSMGFGAGLEFEASFPVTPIFNLTTLLGAKYLFERTVLELGYALFPIYVGSKAALSFAQNSPWSVHAIIRLGYALFLPSTEYQQRALDFRNLYSVGGFYLNTGAGVEVSLNENLSLISQAVFDMSLIDTIPVYEILGEVKNIQDYRLEFLLGLSILLQ